jgi:hypothetical protein
LALDARKIHMLMDEQIYLGGTGGSKPTAAQRRFVISAEPTDGQDSATVGSQRTLVFLLDTIPAGGFGRALVHGVVAATMTAGSAGKDIFVDGGNPAVAGAPTVTSPFTVGASFRLARQVGRVLAAGLVTDDPPGAMYFDGRPGAFEHSNSACAVPIGIAAWEEPVGAPTHAVEKNGFPGPYNTDDLRCGFFYQAVCNAQNDEIVMVGYVMVNKWLSQWPNLNALFRLRYRTTRIVDGATAYLTIESSERDVGTGNAFQIYSDTIPVPGTTDWTDLTLGISDILVFPDALQPGRIFNWQIYVKFDGASSANKDEWNFQQLECGLPFDTTRWA